MLNTIDLFVDPAHRRKGVATALILATADNAEEKGAIKLTWLSHNTNKGAHVLYNKIGQHDFIHYRIDLPRQKPEAEARQEWAV
jgi:GNAT superfamily N-acetyltransferase